MIGLKRFAFCLLAVLIVAGSSIVSAATPTQRWEPMASTCTSAQASAYVFSYSVQGTTSGVPILGATCTTTTAPLVKTCSVPLPQLIHREGGVMTLRGAANPNQQMTEDEVTDSNGHTIGLRCKAADMTRENWTQNERRCTFVIDHDGKHSWELTDEKPETINQATAPTSKL